MGKITDPNHPYYIPPVESAPKFDPKIGWYVERDGVRYKKTLKGYMVPQGHPQLGKTNLVTHGVFIGGNTRAVYDYKEIPKIARRKKIKRP